MTSPYARPQGSRRRLPVRRPSAVLAALALVTGAAACSGGDRAGPTAAPSPAPHTVETEPEPAPRVEAKVRVTRVSGTLKDRDRDVLADNVGGVVTAYFDDAFLGGDQPRHSFADAFDTFSDGAARQADADRDLLTNRVLGPSTQSIEVRRQTAYLSVLAPYKVAAGVTARIHLRYVTDHGDAPSQLVVVKGRLMLTRSESGGWKIFGYDLDQSTRTVGEAS